MAFLAQSSPDAGGVGIGASTFNAFNKGFDLRHLGGAAGRSAANHGAAAMSRQMFRHILIPGALPITFSGLRLSLGTSLTVIIAAEFVAAKYVPDYIIWFSWQTLLTENMFAGLVVIMILGALFTSGLHALERRFMPWQREQRPASADASDTGNAGAK
jgi:ABC-type spermidine/putrescine transport system permease subunit II